MDADDLTIWDVESGILTGTILERQKDTETQENKYRIGGRAMDGENIEVISKFSLTGKLVIITGYTA
jgi:hypothetical protein